MSTGSGVYQDRTFTISHVCTDTVTSSGTFDASGNVLTPATLTGSTCTYSIPYGPAQDFVFYTVEQNLFVLPICFFVLAWALVKIFR